MLVRNNKKYVVFIALLLITSIMSTLFLCTTDIKAAVLESKYYYLYLEKNNLKDIKKDLKDYYKEKCFSESSYDYKASAKLDGDLIKYDEELKAIADYLSKFEFNMKYNFNSKDLKNIYYTLFLGTKYNNKDFVDIDIKSADKKMIISFPSLTEKVIGIEDTRLYELSANLTYALLYDNKAFEQLFGVSRDTYEKMIEKYLKNAIFDQIPNNKVVFDRDASFEDIDCNSITFNIDKEVIANIYKSVAKELENDKDIRTICYTISNTFIDYINQLKGQNSDFEKFTAEEIDEDIISFCESLYDDAENLDDIQIEYTAYFKDNGDILSREFIEKESDVEIALSTFKDSLGNDTIRFNVKENKDITFEIINKKKLQNSLYNGECNLNIFDKNLIKAEYTYEKDAKVGGLDTFVGSIKGKVNLEQFKGDSEYMSLISDLNDIYFNINNKRKDNNTLQGKYAFTSKIDGKRMGITVYTEVKQSNTANISKPIISLDDAIMPDNEIGMEKFLNEISESIQEKIIGILLFGNSEGEYLD